MALSLETNDKYLSEVINDEFGQNFNNYMNEFRVNHAIELLSSGEKRHFTIDAISKMSGFHSKSTFNSAFKRMTGVTPSYCIKSLKEES